MQTIAAQSNTEAYYSGEVLIFLIITETARAPTRVQKMLSIEYIREAIIFTDPTDDFYFRIQETLEYLVFEGSENPPQRIRYRNQYEFPDVRIEAVRILGTLNTTEAGNALRELLLHEKNTDVLYEAENALSRLGEK